MRIASVGHAALAAIVIAQGALGLVRGDFMPIWQPVPKDLPGRELLVLACASVSLASGIALLWRRFAALGARVLLAQLVLWLLVFRAREVVLAPKTFGAWDGCAEAVAVIAGVWVLHAWFAGAWDRRHLSFTTGDTGLHVARVLYGLALIAFGLAHFIYPDETAALVPRWLPAHALWAYLTGGAFLLAAAAVLSGVGARLAATLSAIQIGLFTVLVWIPIVAAGSATAFAWSELGISAALTAAATAVADSYRGRGWFAWTISSP
jgi:uncharacterized membrane protein